MYKILYENTNDDNGIQVLKTFKNLTEAKKGIVELFLGLAPNETEDKEYYDAMVEKLKKDASTFITSRKWKDEDASYKLVYYNEKKN